MNVSFVPRLQLSARPSPYSLKLLQADTTEHHAATRGLFCQNDIVGLQAHIETYSIFLILNQSLQNIYEYKYTIIDHHTSSPATSFHLAVRILSSRVECTRSFMFSLHIFPEKSNRPFDGASSKAGRISTLHQT